jgi:predicted Ser/Thr protein kinase
MHKITIHMSLWARLFFISIAIVSAQTAAPGQNDYRFPNSQVLATQQKVANYDHPLHEMVSGGEQKDIKYAFLDSKMLQAGYPSEQATIDLPLLPLRNWNEAHTHLDRHSGTHSIRNTTKTSHLEMVDIWHHRKIDHLEFVKVEVLQHDRMQVVTHPDFDAPVLIKTASFPWEILSLEREATVYGLLHGSGATPEFHGYVTEGGRVIGFITEYIAEVPSIRGRNMQGCLAALRTLHRRGIAHGDAHDGNCLIRKDGSAVLIDFELSVETWSLEEFERDLDIIGRCIQELSEHPY